jgi:hypothetical protein
MSQTRRNLPVERVDARDYAGCFQLLQGKRYHPRIAGEYDLIALLATREKRPLTLHGVVAKTHIPDRAERAHPHAAGERWIGVTRVPGLGAARSPRRGG